MRAERQNRRADHRCSKDVGMHCSPLHGKGKEIVTLRNFSQRGIYFESSGDFPIGSFVVLRTVAGAEWVEAAAPFRVPDYSVSEDDPEACATFRSHTVARVQRCERLHEPGDPPRYGIGAQIELWND